MERIPNVDFIVRVIGRVCIKIWVSGWIGSMLLAGDIETELV
jgi:hypothetical protein